MNAERCLWPGEVGFYSVLPLVCLPCNWLVSRACGSGQVNDYQLHERAILSLIDDCEVAVSFGARNRAQRENCYVERWPLAMWVFPHIIYVYSLRYLRYE